MQLSIFDLHDYFYGTNMIRIWVYLPWMSTFMHEFLFKSYLTPTLNILMKFKLGVIVTIDGRHHLRKVYFQKKKTISYDGLTNKFA